MTTYTKNAECVFNKNYDKKQVEYKIFIIYNHTNNAYHASYTTQKYLSSVLANLKRKDTDTMIHLFSGDTAMIELLDVIETDNVYYVKERIAELLHRTKDKTKISKSTILSVWKQTDEKYTPPPPPPPPPEETQKTHKAQEQKRPKKPKELDFNGEIDLNDIDEFDPLPEVKKEKKAKCKNDKEPIWCQKCNCEVSYTNWSRHQQTKKHTR